MTIEDLLEKTADELEKMTDEELRKFFEPYFQVTRPEFAPKTHKPTGKPTAIVQTKQFAAKVEQLKGLGIDVSHMLKPKKKR